MQKVFLVPGLGADERLFNHLDLSGFKVIPISWIPPDKTDTLKSYAQKLVEHYHIDKGSVVIGVSLGGILTTEIANLVPLKKAILISSVKTAAELPWVFKLYRWLPLYQLLSEKQFKLLTTLAKPFFGQFSEAEWALFKDMFYRTPASFMRWAIHAILSWKNTIVPPNLCHMVGNKDLVFNYRRIKGAQLIEGGTHMMIFDKASEINPLIHQCLTE